MPRNPPIAAFLPWSAFVLLLGACRVVAPRGGFELEGAGLLGLRSQPGWENSEAPLIRLDAAARPWSWPVGVKVSTDLSGYFGDDTGEQTIGFGLGLARSIELVPARLAGSLGLGHLFFSTDNGDLFAAKSDSWQANYVEAGLYYGIAPASDLTIGLEARYSTGDGPDLGVERLDGDFLDVFLLLQFGWPGRPAAP